MVLAVAGAGCGAEHTKNYKTDEQFIRLPGDKAAAVAMKQGSLLPATVGSYWEMVLDNGNGTGREKVVVTHPETIDGIHGINFSFRQKDAKGIEKMYREEVYTVNKSGISLLSSSDADNKMIMKPPVPLIPLPLQEGKSVEWTGMIRVGKNATLPATALSRISGLETVTTPAGAFGAYRVDTVVTTMRDGQPIAFPTTRWMAPGVGIVKQKLISYQQSGQSLVRSVVWKMATKFYIAPEKDTTAPKQAL